MSDDWPLIRVTGPDVTEEHVREIGEQFAKLLNVIAEEMHGCSLDVQCTGAKRICDGCDTMAPTFERPSGWVTMPDGHDYCADCMRAADETA